MQQIEHQQLKQNNNDTYNKEGEVADGGAAATKKHKQGMNEQIKH